MAEVVLDLQRHRDLRPNSFANFGAGYAGSRDGYVYLTAIAPTSSAKSFYLLRAP